MDNSDSTISKSVNIESIEIRSSCSVNIVESSSSNTVPTSKTTSFNAGHRGRLRERFMKVPLRSLPDYEILEMLLHQVIIRKDTKKLAKDLLKRFTSLQGVIFADVSDLKSVEGIGECATYYIKFLADLFSRMCIPIADNNFHVLSNWLSVLNYCQLTMGFKKKEYFRILFLNKRNVLIADEFLDTGTVDKVIVYPREIAKFSLLYGASAVILIHNHPSGNTNPSKEDIDITSNIERAILAIGVQLHDHIIVSADKHFSFRGNGLI